MKTISIQSELWRQRYEALRQYALTGRGLLATPPLGLHLLRHHGVAGWMKRWVQSSESSVPVMPPPPVQSLCPPAWQQELTVLLAEMAAQHFHPVTP